MVSTLHLQIVGVSLDFVTDVAAALDEQAIVEVTSALIEDGHLRPLSKDQGNPHAIVLCMEPGSVEGFGRVIQALPKPKPLLFGICSDDDIQLLRDAMRLGMRDYFQLPLSSDQLIADIQRVVVEEHELLNLEECSTRLTAFINAKGGSGASFIAATTAMEMAREVNGSDPKNRQLLLMDLDLQFGSLPTYFNLMRSDGLIKALELADTLDATALRGYIQPHESGVHLLAAAMDHVVLPEDVSKNRIELLLRTIASAYRELVVDLPRRIDTAVATLLDHADTVVVVTQQSIAHLQDAQRLVLLLRDRIGIPEDRFLLLVNRYDKKMRGVSISDYQEAFPRMRIETLPGDFLRVSESINSGIPIGDLAPRSPLTKAVSHFARGLIHHEPAEDDVGQGWLARLGLGTSAASRT